MYDLAIVQALANDRRLQIMEWLKDPEPHFWPQFDGDMVKVVSAQSLLQKNWAFPNRR